MPLTLQDLVVISAVRTPMGKFGGALHEIPVYNLGARAIWEALKQAGVSPSEVDDVLLGCCRHAGNGTNPARTAARLAGLPANTPATTITMACASGMRSVILGSQSLLCGDANLVVCGGMESMSTIPYLFPELRWKGLRFGHQTLFDGWHDSRDPFVQDQSTGISTEVLVAKHNITREEQDRFAAESHRKAASAATTGLFEEEIIPLPLNGGKNANNALFRDETIREDTSPDQLAVLPPVFTENGTLTAGNSSPFSDGAAVLVLTHRKKATEIGAKPLFSLVSYAQGAVDNMAMGEGPSQIFPVALAKAKMILDNVDFIELNEGFAGMALVNERLLKLDRSRLNKNGGAIALGHPVGASGARIVVTLYHVLKHFNGEIGGAVIGAAGGVCTALIIKRES